MVERGASAGRDGRRNRSGGAEFLPTPASVAGFHPSKRQPMPGTTKLWQGMTFLSGAVLGYQAMRDRRQNRWENGDGDALSQA